MHREPPSYWRGNVGLAMFVSFTVICVGLNWCAWVGGPAGQDDGVFFLRRSQGGVNRPVSERLYWIARAMLGLCFVGGGGVVCTLAYWGLVPRRRDSRRCFAKPTLVLLVASMVSGLVGAALDGHFP